MPAPLLFIQVSITESILHAGPVSWTVLAILLVLSVLSWTIIFAKWSRFRKARAANTQFLRAFRKANGLEAIAVASEQFRVSPLVTVFDFGYAEVDRQVKSRGTLTNKLALERTLQLGISEEVARLERNMNWLATTATVSPFIGLLRDGLGHHLRLRGLAQAGSASLRAVAPGISEALVATAMRTGRGDPGRGLLQLLRHCNSRIRRANGRLLARVSEYDRTQLWRVRDGVLSWIIGGGTRARPLSRRHRTLSEINVVPLVDVVLVLLIIFMLTAHVMEFGLEVEVPEVKQVRNTAEELPVVTITTEWRDLSAEKPVNINPLGDTIRSPYPEAKGIYLRADKGTVWDPIAQVISALGEAKLDVRVVTQPEDEADRKA